ncbi:hypothetical protein CH063_13069, partial [Colletotrichum higginsianum]
MFFKKRNEGAAVDTMTPTTDRPASSRTSKTPDDDDDQQRRHHQPAQHALAHTSTTRSEIQYPSGLKLFLIMLSILVSMFLVAL